MVLFCSDPHISPETSPENAVSEFISVCLPSLSSVRCRRKYPSAFEVCRQLRLSRQDAPASLPKLQGFFNAPRKIGDGRLRMPSGSA